MTAIAAMGCGESKPSAVADAAGSIADGATGGDASSAGAATWYKTALPVLQRRCNQCHVKGGAAPFALDDYASAKAMLPAGLASIAAKRMPPWMPSGDCRHYAAERGMPAEDVAALQAWQAAGAPLGDPAQAPPAATATDAGAQLPDRAPDWQLQAVEPYTADAKQPDDYRCFAVGPAITAETWTQAMRITPGDKASVHHVILYLIAPSAAAQVDKKDAASPGLGWTCFGGPGVNPAQNIGGWVPGTVPQVHTDEAGIRIPPGSRLVLQVHYNTNGHVPKPDQTRADVWLHAKPPKNLLTIRPLPNFGIAIAAGDANSQHSKVFENTGAATWNIVSVTAHMHQLGKRIAVHKEGKDGQSAACLVDIEHWDFNWQQSYRFLPGENVAVAPGERLVLECSYDNSQGHQPVVNGQQKPPVNVTWGEGTADEMCLAYVTLIEPYVELPKSSGTDAACNGAQGCLDDCKATGGSAGLCAIQCGSKKGGKCLNCLLPGIIGCGAQNGCPSQAQAVIDCFAACQKDPAGVQSCVAAKCLAPLAAFNTCSAPLLAEGGLCHGEGDSCGVQF